MRRNPDPAAVARLTELTTLSPDEIDQVASAGQLVNLPARWKLIWERTPADAAYYILEGEVSIQRDKEEVAQLGAGDIIGEMAILHHKLRAASVFTLTPVKALNFSAEAVATLSENIPRLGEAIRSTSTERLESNTNG